MNEKGRTVSVGSGDLFGFFLNVCIILRMLRPIVADHSRNPKLERKEKAAGQEILQMDKIHSEAASGEQLTNGGEGTACERDAKPEPTEQPEPRKPLEA